MNRPPENFRRLALESPFATTIQAEFFEARVADKRLVRVQVGPQHCNSAGFVHGGFLLAFADLALSYGTHDPEDTPPRITLHMEADFMRVAGTGDWLEAEVEVHKQSRNLIFAVCLVRANEKTICRASGLFKPVPPKGQR